MEQTLENIPMIFYFVKKLSHTTKFNENIAIIIVVAMKT
jgi:hypothetical protein